MITQNEKFLKDPLAINNQGVLRKIFPKIQNSDQKLKSPSSQSNITSRKNHKNKKVKILNNKYLTVPQSNNKMKGEIEEFTPIQIKMMNKNHKRNEKEREKASESNKRQKSLKKISKISSTKYQGIYELLNNHFATSELILSNTEPVFSTPKEKLQIGFKQNNNEKFNLFNKNISLPILKERPKLNEVERIQELLNGNLLLIKNSNSFSNMSAKKSLFTKIKNPSQLMNKDLNNVKKEKVKRLIMNESINSSVNK